MTEAPLGLLFRRLRSRWGVLLLLPFATMFVAASCTVFKPTQWRSDATLEFPPMPSALDVIAATDPNSGASGGGGGLLSALTGSDDRLERYVAVLQSLRIRTEVVDDIPLHTVLGVPSPKSAIRQLQKRAQFKTSPGQMIRMAVTLPGPSLIRQLMGAKTDTARETAAKVADAYIKRLRVYLNEVTASHERAEKNYIGPQLVAARKHLDDIIAQQLKMLKTGPPLMPKDQQPLIADLLGRMNASRADLIGQLVGARREIIATKAQAANAPMMVQASLQRAKNPEIDRLQAMATDSQARIYVMRNIEGKSDAHPDVRRELDSSSQLEKKLRDALAQSLQVAGEQTSRNPTYDALRQAYSLAVVKEATVKVQLDAINKGIAESLSTLRGITPRAVTQMQLEAQYAEEYAMYSMLRKALAAVELEEQRTSEIFVVLDAPESPVAKSGPSLVVNSIAGLMLGIALMLLIGEASMQLRAWAAREQSAPSEGV
jgi:uncharacterized protein involved in exopolysaccharide biosynthesis